MSQLERVTVLMQLTRGMLPGSVYSVCLFTGKMQITELNLVRVVVRARMVGRGTVLSLVHGTGHKLITTAPQLTRHRAEHPVSSKQTRNGVPSAFHKDLDVKT